MRGGGGAAVAFEEWLEARDDAILEEIRAYNEDDCRSLYELHRWLLELRPAEVEWRAAARGARAQGGGEGAARGARARRGRAARGRGGGRAALAARAAARVPPA